MIGLGSLVNDTLSNFTGVVVQVTSYLGGAMTYTIKGQYETRTLDSSRVVLA